MRGSKRRKICERPNGKEHQADKEKNCERKDSIDHFPFGDQMHEITGDQKGFAAGDDESDADINGAVAEGNVRGAYGNEGAEKEGVKNEQIAPNVVAKVIGMLIAHKLE